MPGISPNPMRSAGSDDADAGALARLNPQQREVALHATGPLLVLAGAGTGKTTALTGRLAHLVQSRIAWPSQLLAVTFTNKAANMMRERISASAGPDSVPYWLGTFHALCGRMLRSHAEHVHLPTGFSILPAYDAQQVVRNVLDDLQIDRKRWPEAAFASAIDRWKNAALAPEQIADEDSEALAFGKGREVYTEYQRRLLAMGSVDFGDLILHVIQILQHHPSITETYRSKFRFILVDEYQDTNIAQYMWLRLITGESGNICCVGDDDQAIYGWRGAQVDHILNFERDYPNAHVIRLEQNYRSTAKILACGSGVIQHNRGRLGKTLRTERASGDPVRLGYFHEGLDEADWISREILTFTRGHRGSNPVPLDEMAILVRATALDAGARGQAPEPPDFLSRGRRTQILRSP